MSKIIVVYILGMFLLSGCKEEGCKTLSWKASSDSRAVSLRSTAGNQCGNISDYYDIDIEGIISKIQKMKLVKNSDCTQVNYESGEDEVEECPEFIPETIEFKNLISCTFGTPPGEGYDCIPAPLVIKFGAEMFFDFVSWDFGEYNFDFYSNNTVLFSKKDEKSMMGQFNSNDLTSATIKFTWNETVEGASVKKEMSLDYTVETKE